jgi:hypothetical protein
VPSGHGTIWVRAKTGQVPCRIELTCRKKSSHCRDPHNWLRLAHLIHVNSPANDHADMSFEASREILRYPQKVIDSLAKWLTCRPVKSQETRASTPSSEPILSRAFLRTIPTVLPNLRGGKSDLDRKLCSTNESQSLITNIREGKKGSAEGTRERSTPAPPEAEGPSGRHLKVEHHQ